MNELITALLTALIGGLIGTYGGACFLSMRENRRMKKVRAIALKALDVLNKYSKQSCRNAESEFNTLLSITEKRMVIVALHKLGIPIGVPTTEVFDIRKIYFIDRIIDKEELDGIAFQIKKGYCDNLFYQDPETYFATNYTIFAMRNAGKKYVNEILSKMVINPETKQFKEPISDLSQIFTLGEFKAIQVLREQIRDQMYFDENGQPIKAKLDTLIKDIDLGLWDSYFMWNYEAYQSVKMQIEMGQAIATVSKNVSSVKY